MSAGFYLKLFIATLVIFFVIDIIWLGFLARGYYRAQLGTLLSPRANWAAAVAFYLIFNVGLMVFAILPGLESGSLGRTLLLGALYGLFTYATYDLTNLATLRNWPLALTIVDIGWGIVLSTSVAGLSFSIGRWLGSV